MRVSEEIFQTFIVKSKVIYATNPPSGETVILNISV
jgi:hypothetical protein